MEVPLTTLQYLNPEYRESIVETHNYPLIIKQKSISRGLLNLEYSEYKRIFAQKFECEICLVRDEIEDDLFKLLVDKLAKLNSEISLLNKDLHKSLANIESIK